MSRFLPWLSRKLLCESQNVHEWEIVKRSNLLQFDDMGYPLRLFIVECKRCGKIDQWWIDVPVEEVKELETGESVEVKWQIED